MKTFLARSAHRDLIIGLVLLGLLALIPQFGVSRYVLGQIVLFMIYGAVAMHWNLLFGYAGIFSLAQLMLFGIGAYAMAMLNFYLNIPILVAIPLAGVVAMAASIVLGLATLRLRGVYTALLTLAAAQMVTVLIVTDTECFMKTETACRMFTGGAAGFYGFEDFGTRKTYRGAWLTANYYIVLVAAAATVAATLVLIHSGLGLSLRAMRDNPGYAQALGVNRFQSYLKVFVATALLTGLMGAVYAGHIRTVSPSVMSLNQMLYLVAAVIVGGAGRSWGALLGLAVLMAADEFLRDYGNMRQIGIGVILVLAPIFFRDGLLGLSLSRFIPGVTRQNPVKPQEV